MRLLISRGCDRYQLRVEAALQKQSHVVGASTCRISDFTHAAELFILGARKWREHDLEITLIQPFKGLEPLRGTGNFGRLLVESIVPTFILGIDGLFREGLRLILSRTRFRPQSCQVELEELTAVPSDIPALFIVGIGQKYDSVSKLKNIRDRYPLSLIVAIGDESHRQCMASALGAGANAALYATVTPSGLVSSLHAIMSGGVIIMDSRLWPSDIPSRGEEPALLPIVPPKEDEPQPKQLSAREMAILQRIIRGDSNKHVARFFEIAEATVKAHVKAIFRKIGATNRTQAAMWALNHRLLDGLDGARDISQLVRRDKDLEVIGSRSA